MTKKLDETISEKPRESAAKKTDSQLGGRDVIYVDIDDDITSVIEKVKKAEKPIVALVPPARAGVLNSVVSLRLLQKSAKAAKKQIALITTDRSLTSLAAGLKIPVAKSVNKQAEIPEMSENVSFATTKEEIIDGDEIPVGELDAMAKTAKNSREDKDISAAVAAIETDDKIKDGDKKLSDQKIAKKPKRDTRIPNFDVFRKKLFIGGAAGVLLIGFLVWAIFFAPHGTITIKAKTTEVPINSAVNLFSNQSTDVKQNQLQPTVKTAKKTLSTTVQATGKKDVGEKARGVVSIAISEAQLRAGQVQIVAGTTLSNASNTLQYSVNNTVSFPSVNDMKVPEYFKYVSENCSGGACYINASVTAAKSGENYNLAADEKLTVSGGGYTATVGSGGISGGTNKTIAVVAKDDVDSATKKLKDEADVEAVKKDLQGQMGSEITIIDESFGADFSKVESSPKIGEEASGGAKISVEVTYTLIGVQTSDLEKFLAEKATEDGANGSKVFDNGAKNLNFSGFTSIQNGYRITISTIAQLGPEIDEAQIKQQAVGKKSSEISAQIEKINGVTDASVKFSPFWVSTLSSPDKFKVDFAVDEQ